MFFNGIVKKYDVDLMIGDISLHSGIPKDYYNLKDHNFGDWEIPPWELFIFKDRLLGEGSFFQSILSKMARNILL